MNFDVTDSKQPGFAATLVITEPQEPVDRQVLTLDLTFEDITKLLHNLGVHYRAIGLRLNDQVRHRG